MEELLKGIREKLKLFNFNFNYLELDLIINNSDIQKELIDVLLNYNEEWSKELFLLVASIQDSVFFNNERYEYVIYQYYLANIKYSPVFFEEDFENVLLSNPQYIEEIKRKCSVDEYLLSLNPSNYLLEYLLNHKKYDLISKYNFGESYISFEVIEKFVKEYPFEKYGFPNVFGSHLDNFASLIEYMNLDTLLRAFCLITASSDRVANKNLSQKKDEIMDLIIQKMSNLDEVKNAKLDVDLNKYDFYLYNLEMKKVSSELVKNGNYFFIEFCNDSVDFRNKVLENVKSNELSYLSLKKILCNSSNGVIKMLPEFVDIFLENVDFEPLIINYDNFELNDRYKINEKIEELLKKKDRNVIEFVNNCYDKLPDDIIMLAINNNILKRVYIDNKNSYTIFRNLLNYLNANPDIPLEISNKDFTLLQKDDICQMLLLSKRDDLFFDFLKRNYYYGNFSEETTKYILDRMKNSEGFLLEFLNKSLITKLELSEDLLNVIPFSMIKKLSHEDICDFETYLKYKNTLVKIYNLDVSKLDKFVLIFGPNFLTRLDDRNILEFLNLSDKEFEKLIDLFKVDTYNLTDLEATYDSIKQYQFGKSNSDVINILADILLDLDQCDIAVVVAKYIYKLKECDCKNFIEEFSRKFGEKNRSMSFEELFKEILVDLKYEKDNEEYGRNKLHFLTEYYIKKKREEYRLDYNLINELNIPFECDQKSLISFKINYLLKNEKELVAQIVLNHGFSISMIDDIFNFLENVHAEFKNPRNEVVSNIRILRNILGDLLSNAQEQSNKPVIFYDEKFEIDDILKSIFSTTIFMDKLEEGVKNGIIKTKYVLNKSCVNKLNILVNLRLDVLQEKLLGNDELYDFLLKLLHKRKLLNLPEFLVDFINEEGTDLSFSDATIISIINYCYKIFSNMDYSEFPSLPILLNAVSPYLQVSSVYSQIFGPEDADYIISNSGANSGVSTKEDRLNGYLEMLINNYARDEVTIPTFNTVFEYDDKSIRCVVGNFSNPCNLTHGMRTDSCMRIGGVGESLLRFALENKNGFHIRFENPETGEYVSRVTGFRNGNTVFLNELRYSCDKNGFYSDEDLIKFCEMSSKKIIELSKFSRRPILNVIIHCDYVTIGMDNQCQDLNINSVRDGFPYFYCDVGNKDIVLASANYDNSLIPINFDKTDIPSYVPARELVKESSKIFEMSSLINRVHAIRSYLSNNNLSIIEPLDFLTGFKYGVANQDWYIYIDDNDNIHEELIDIDPRAREELEIAKNKLREKSNSIKK